MSISSPGIGSGLDISSLVSQLVAAEGESTANRLNQREAAYLADISAFGLLKSSLFSFQSTVNGLKSTSDFQQRTGVSSDSSIFTVATFSTADISSYDIEVVQLAKAQKLITKNGFFSTPTDTVGAGTLKFTQDSSSFSISVGASDTVEDVRDAINNATDNSGVRAAILVVDDGAGGTESKLVFSATKTGLDNTITVEVDEGGDGQYTEAGDLDSAGLSRLINANVDESVSALDGKIKVDSQLVLSSNNKFSSVLNGVTITAKEVGSGETLTVTEDKALVTSKVETFISSYNKLVETFTSLSSYDADSKIAGALLGNSVLRGAESSVRQYITSPVLGLNSSFTTLAELGVTTGDDGKLTLDQATLDQVLDSNFDELGAFFASTNGLSTKLDTLIEGYVNTTGVINSRTNGLQTSVDGIQEQREELDRRLGSLESRLLKQFGALDALVNSLQSQSSFLTQQLANLPGAYKPKN